MPHDETSPHQPRPVTKAQNVFAILLIVIFLGALLGGGTYWRRHSSKGASGATTQTGTGVATSDTVVQKVNDLTITIHMPGGLRLAQNEMLIEFRKGSERVDVGNVKFSLDMNMSGMTMHDSATVSPTGTPGQYRAKIKPEMGGDWIATLEYAGPEGQGRTTFPVSVKQ